MEIGSTKIGRKKCKRFCFQVVINNVHLRYLDHVSCVQPVVVGLCVRQILVPADGKSKRDKQQNQAVKNVTVESVSLYTYLGDTVRSGCFFSKDWSDSQFQVCHAEQRHTLTVNLEALFPAEDSSLNIVFLNY